ncbi:MAG TPA: hypothetical protein VGV61_00095, partial [Thermoanaerobaculia bacterium]|nr:hypothetical protein [Thermoanaerobaculia bacterium]
MRRRLQVLLLIVLVGTGAAAGYRAVDRWRQFRRADATCAAAEARDWRRALAASGGELPPNPSGLRTADCRCVALVSNGRQGECVALLERLLADPRTGDWLPRPALTAELVEALRAKGALSQATQLAGRGVDHSPSHLPLLALESSLRQQLEPDRALDTMARRIPTAGSSAPQLRTFLAAQAVDRGDWERTLTLLGDHAPDDHGHVHESWYLLRMMASARLGRGELLAATTDEWAAKAPNPAKAHAFYGYLLSTTEQDDPQGRSNIELLREGVSAPAQVGDERLLKLIWMRFVGELTVAKRGDEALRAFDAGVARFGDLFHLDRADLARTALAGRAGEEATLLTGGPSTVELRVQAPAPGMRLLVSPPSTTPHDTPFGSYAVPASGRVVVERPPDTWPLRWVLRDGSGAVRGSGAVWPQSRASVTAPVVPHRPVPPVAAPPLAQRPASDRRRLFVVILDCADWRFVAQGLARSELPTFAALLQRGDRAVLSSIPAFTAVAVRSIAQPGARGVAGVLGVLHQLGDEIAGLNFVGRNPLAPISWLLPDTADL